MDFIKILKNTRCGGKNRLAGDEIDATKEDADILEGMGKAIRIPKKKIEPKKKALPKKEKATSKKAKKREKATK